MMGAPTGGYASDQGFQAPGNPRATPLGLGLGLRAGQRGRFMEAAQQGRGQDFLSNHPEIQRRFNAGVAGGGDRASALQNFASTGVAPSGAHLRYAQPGGGMARPSPVETAAPGGPDTIGGEMDRQERFVAGEREEAARQADMQKAADRMQPSTMGRVAAGMGSALQGMGTMSPVSGRPIRPVPRLGGGGGRGAGMVRPQQRRMMR